MERVLIIDGHGLAFRAFYAVPLLNAPDGTPTNAILGFMNMLIKVEDEVAPCCCAVVFDAPGPTFRHEIFPEYKAGRKPTPEEFKPQIPLLKELLMSLGYPVVMDQGVEADDVIASMARCVVEVGRQAVVVSSDKDLLQILGNGVKMLRPVKGITVLKDYDEASFSEEYGFSPQSMPDYLALMGDAADNVPGVPGIGEKTAAKVTIPFAVGTTNESTLEGQLRCYGNSPSEDAANYLVIYTVLKDGTKWCYIYDVTKQIKEAPNPYEVEIVLDKLPVPTNIGGNSGFTPGVSDWNIIEIPIVMQYS